VELQRTGSIEIFTTFEKQIAGFAPQLTNKRKAKVFRNKYDNISS